MQIRIFNIPITDNGEIIAELNSFLSNNKILEIEQKFFPNEKTAYWCFCVRFLIGASSNYSAQSKKQKIDYKEILSEREFQTFAKLRECRKTISINEAIPAYAVFTDEELAGISRLPILEPDKLTSIKGIGDKKTEKFGQTLIDLFKQKLAENEKTE
jgi:superfamily II DNA helicase RecQ